MSKELTNKEQQVLIFVLRENKASLEAELNLLKSETAHSMVMCKCTKRHKLPSESVCKVCKIEELEAKIKRMEDNLITDCEPCPFDEAATTLQKYTNKIEADLAASQTEANDLRVRVEGLLRVVEELSNG